MADQNNPFRPHDHSGDAAGKDLNPDSVNTDRAFTNAVTMYVRSDGDDADDGLTGQTANATIEGAIANAPLHGGQDKKVVVNIKEAATFTRSSKTSTEGWQSNSIRIVGATDGSGNPATVMDFEGGTATWIVRGTDITFKNIRFTNSGAEYVWPQGASVTLENCETETVTGRTHVNCGVRGTLSIGRDTVMTQDTDTADRPIVAYEDGGGKIFGTLQQTGSVDATLVEIYDGAGRIDFAGCTISGIDGVTRRLVAIQSPRHIKLNSGVTFENSTYAIGEVSDFATVVMQGGAPTLNNVPNLFNSPAGGAVGRAGSSATSRWYLPRDPDLTMPDVAQRQGEMVVEKDKYPLVRPGPDDGWMNFGYYRQQHLGELSNPTEEVLGLHDGSYLPTTVGPYIADPSNNRWQPAGKGRLVAYGTVSVAANSEERVLTGLDLKHTVEANVGIATADNGARLEWFTEWDNGEYEQALIIKEVGGVGCSANYQVFEGGDPLTY